jgi:glutaredoxin
MNRVTLYTKDGCHLCEEARTVLDRVRKDLPFEFEEVYLRDDDTEFAGYRESIPVVTVNGAEAFKFRVNEKRLRALLAGAGGS